LKTRSQFEDVSIFVNLRLQKKGNIIIMHRIALYEREGVVRVRLFVYQISHLFSIFDG